MIRGKELAAISRRLGVEATQRLGRRFTVRLRDRGALFIVDWERRLSHCFSWESDEPETSPVNRKHWDAVLRQTLGASDWWDEHEKNAEPAPHGGDSARGALSHLPCVSRSAPRDPDWP